MRRIPKSEVLHQELNQILEGIFDDLAEGKLEERESWLSMVMKRLHHREKINLRLG